MAAVLTTLAQGAVATAGTRVRLVPADISNVIKLWVFSPTANTGSIFFGDVNVSATRGIEIPKGTFFVVEAQPGMLLDLRNMYVDAATSGDDFQVTYLSKV